MNSDFDDNTIYIIDSYGLIYRCYYAFISRPLTNSKGQNVSALFGFFRNLHAVLNHYKPKTIVAALDSISKTFRHEMFPDYKATRKKTPEDLHEQIPWIEDAMTVLGIPSIRCEGYEADDVIATITTKAIEQGKKCRILSGDKDLMQLVCNDVQILKPDHSDVWKVVGSEGVQAEWGVLPSRLLDLLSLCGDSADNVPGVKGIGEKTASSLIQKYDTLEGIYEHIEELKGAQKQKLLDGKESAFFSKKLIELCTKVPCAKLDKITENIFDYSSCAKKLREYEVPAVAKLYDALSGITTRNTSPATGINSSVGITTHDTTPKVSEVVALKKNIGNYKAVTLQKDFAALIENIINQKEKIIAFDTETDSLDSNSAALVGCSFCNMAGEAVYIPITTSSEDLFSQDGIPLNDALVQLKKIFSNPEFIVIMHNAKFDYKVLRTQGLTQNDFKAKIFDTMIASWLLNPDRTERAPYSLETLGRTRLGLIGIEYDEVVQKGETFRDVPLEKAVPYAAEDADFTWQLYILFKDELNNKNLNELFQNVEMPLIPILAEMELKGIHLEASVLSKYGNELSENLKSTENQIYKTVGHEFNISSTKQLQEVLFTERGLKPSKKTKTGYSTDTSVLEELALDDEVPKKILEYREMAKLQSTYVEALPKLLGQDARIHTTFLQTGTATGRLSSRDPNLQNIPVRNDAGRKIRTAFTAAQDMVLISADYAQIELVVLAHLSKDKNMCQAFLEGHDVHKATASLIYGVPPEQVEPQMRRLAKTINFGVIYGMSAFRLSNELSISRTQAAEFIQKYFLQYPSIKDFIDNTVRSAEEKGFVETILGRRRKILNINSKNKMEKAAAERIAVNTPVQGSAADIVKLAMIKVDSALKNSDCGAKLLLQVHDELILECPNNAQAIDEAKSILKDKMENAFTLCVPLRISIDCGKNWGEFH